MFLNLVTLKTVKFPLALISLSLAISFSFSSIFLVVLGLFHKVFVNHPNLNKLDFS
jgi:hypothetical protein